MPRPSFLPPDLRRLVLRMAFHGQSVHIPCAFSIVELMSFLYGEALAYDPARPDASDRDLFVLSKGHGVMAQYACFHELGWIGEREIETYFADGSKLRGLSECDVPGCEATTGSLGHGLPVATGAALGFKRQKSGRKVVCLAGDGEMNEGSMWEAILFAGHQKLANLTLIVDVNQFQAMGRTEDVLTMEPWLPKLRSFGWEAEECDGHSLASIRSAWSRLQSPERTGPKALVARTLKGQGVSFMAGDNTWHYTRLTQDTLDRALVEIEASRDGGSR